MLSIKSKQYNAIAKEYAGMLNITKKHVLIPTFLKLIGDIKKKSVIDLGCGEGFFTRILAKMKPQKIVGVDISQELIKLAKSRETIDRLGIKYITKDVLKFGNYSKQFDVVTSVYLFNYAKTKEELFKMCSIANQLLKKDGVFSIITLNPAIRPNKHVEYERRISNMSGASIFKNGDRVKFETHEKRKKPFEFICYYWSKGVYEECLHKAGLKTIKWVRPIISEEAREKFGEKFWRKFMDNPSPIGIICKK